MESDKYNILVDRLKNAKPQTLYSTEISDNIMRALSQNTAAQTRTINKVLIRIHPVINIAASILICVFIYSFLLAQYDNKEDQPVQITNIQDYFDEKEIQEVNADFQLNTYLSKREEEKQEKEQFLISIYSKQNTSK